MPPRARRAARAFALVFGFAFAWASREAAGRRRAGAASAVNQSATALDCVA